MHAFTASDGMVSHSALRGLKSVRHDSTVIALILLASCAMSSGRSFGGIVIPSFDHGHVANDGVNPNMGTNYAVGDSTIDLWHNWFVFDFASLSEPIVAAELLLYNPPGGFESVDPTEDYTLFDVSTDPLSLAAGMGGIAVYDDLGTGLTYGAYTASAADNDSFIIIELNTDAVASINASLGNLWAVGGALTSLDDVPSTEALFGFSGDVPLGMNQLVVTPIPAPGCLALLAVAALGSSARRRSRR